MILLIIHSVLIIHLFYVALVAVNTDICFIKLYIKE
jgi:hypothetical protein